MAWAAIGSAARLGDILIWLAREGGLEGWHRAYVVKDGMLWGSSSWSHSAGSGTVAAIFFFFFFGVWVLMLLAGVVLALTASRRAAGDDRRNLRTLAFWMPVITVVLVVVAGAIHVGAGGASAIPLDQLDF